VLSLLGWAAGNAGPAASEQAEAFGAEALGLFRALGDTGGQADALFMLGTFRMSTGDYQRAARLFADSVALQRKRGDEKSTTRGLAGLGTALLNLGDRAAARQTLEDSLAVARRFDNRWSTADGDHTRAQAMFAEAASLFADIGNLIYVQWCLEGLAGAAAARGDYELAAELDGARDALRTQLGVLLPPAHPAGYTQTLATIRASLTQAALDVARARPAHETPQQIITAATNNKNLPLGFPS
jgi:tetratricopeptide (TPR) repeat protein